MAVDRENSFEDLEQLLTQLDWASPHGSSIDDTGSDSELTCDHSLQPELDKDHMSELESRALGEHLRAIVKDIHIAIGEPELMSLFACRENEVSCSLLMMEVIGV